MNISFAGLHGTGKSTIAQRIAEHFGFTFYSTGMAFRAIAKEMDMDLKEFSKYTENHPEIDRKMDYKIIELAKTEKNYVFEGQLPTYMLEDLKDFAILLTCDDEVRIRRMARRDEQSLTEQKEETLIREESERERFLELYNIDIADPSRQLATFNMILDTTSLDIDTVFNTCVAVLAGFMGNDSRPS